MNLQENWLKTRLLSHFPNPDPVINSQKTFDSKALTSQSFGRTVFTDHHNIFRLNITMWQLYMVAVTYITTLILGVIGNCWVICSVLRNRRPLASRSHRAPSDRLRTYIFVLAVLDLIVICSLIFRTMYTLLDHLMLGLFFELSILRTCSFSALASLTGFSKLSYNNFEISNWGWRPLCQNVLI